MFSACQVIVEVPTGNAISGIEGGPGFDVLPINEPVPSSKPSGLFTVHAQVMG